MRNILIVDDDRNNRLAIKLKVGKFNDIKIFEAENGAEAVELAQSERFDIIFMDIMMPIMNGIDATKLIKKLNPYAMIIAISAMDDDEHKSLMLAAGAEDYITKPFHPEVLKQRFENYLRLIINRSITEAHPPQDNLFNENIYDRSITFRIVRESSLALLWEEYLFSDRFVGNSSLSDAIRALYDVSLELLKLSQQFSITCEENDDYLFFTIEHPESLDTPLVRQVISHEFRGDYKMDHKRLSIKVPRSITLPTTQKSHEETPLNPPSEEESYFESLAHKSHKYKITALEYTKGMDADFGDKTDDLIRMHDLIDESIFQLERHHDFTQIHLIGTRLSDFAAIVDNLFEFHDLAQSIMSLGELLGSVNIETLQDEISTLIVAFLTSYSSDVENWIKEIFINKTATDIHYLDSSLCSSFLQIRSLINHEKSLVTNGGDELELF